MRKVIRASVLVLVLITPIFAGEIPYGVTGEIPNGATATGVIQNGITGEIPYGDTSSSSQLTVTEILLNLFAMLVP